MSFVVIGLVPAMAVHLIAFLISWTLRRVGRIYDPVSAAIWPALWTIIKRALSALHYCSRVAWKRIVMGATFPIRLFARLLLHNFETILSLTLANFGMVGERILQGLPDMARNFFTVSGAAVTGKKFGAPYFSAHSAQEPLQNWPKSS
jgi:hypothetical protein